MAAPRCRNTPYQPNLPWPRFSAACPLASRSQSRDPLASRAKSAPKKQDNLPAPAGTDTNLPAGRGKRLPPISPKAEAAAANQKSTPPACPEILDKEARDREDPVGRAMW